MTAPSNGIGWVQTVILGVVSVILLGGTIALLLVGRSLPEFLIGFDGAIVMGVVNHGGFLSLLKASQTSTVALAANHTSTVAALSSNHIESINHMRDVIAREHELAMTVTGKTSTLAVPSSGMQAPQ